LLWVFHDTPSVPVFAYEELTHILGTAVGASFVYSPYQVSLLLYLLVQSGLCFFGTDVNLDTIPYLAVA
jgi:hypothetical protein